MGEIFAGRYELIDMIGEGGMGAVWRVRDLKRDRIIAAKVLRQSDAGSLLRFMREQGMRIHHPHVVTPLGWAGEDDKVLFTMPIVEGGSVSTLMGDYGSLPPRFASELLRQMLSALGGVHDTGVVHRDVKPANLLLDATGTDRPHLWLTDFGVAVAVDAPRLTSLSVVLGTPGYLAPEQLRGADPDPRSDLYAAGMVGFQLVTGHRPRPQLRSERLDLPPRPDGTPDILWDLLVRLADPDVTGRPGNAHEALAALDAPELAWAAQGAIEVFRQMPDLPGVSAGDFLRPGDDDADPTESGTLPGAAAPGGSAVAGATRAATGASTVPAATQPSSTQPSSTQPSSTQPSSTKQQGISATRAQPQPGATRLQPLAGPGRQSGGPPGGGQAGIAGHAGFAGQTGLAGQGPAHGGPVGSASSTSPTVGAAYDSRPGALPYPASGVGLAGGMSPASRVGESAAGKPRARLATAVLVSAPVLALLVLGLLIWAPWSGGGGTESPGGAVQGGTCAFVDAGTYEADSKGTSLQCTWQDNAYRWAKPAG